MANIKIQTSSDIEFSRNFTNDDFTYSQFNAVKSTKIGFLDLNKHYK